MFLAVTLHLIQYTLSSMVRLDTISAFGNMILLFKVEFTTIIGHSTMVGVVPKPVITEPVAKRSVLVTNAVDTAEAPNNLVSMAADVLIAVNSNPNVPASTVVITVSPWSF